MTGAADCDAGEQGGATGVETALVWIALIALICAVTQVVLVFYTGQLALTAAQSGVAAGRVAASTAEAEQGVRGFLERAAGSTLSGSAVSAQLDDGGAILRVRVTGRAPSLVPGVPMTVDKSAVGAVERITP